MIPNRDHPVGRLGKRIIEILSDAGYTAVLSEDAAMWSAMREKYEVSASALQAITEFGDHGACEFASATISRLEGPGGATPFDDLRQSAQGLRDDVKGLKASIEALLIVIECGAKTGSPGVDNAVRKALVCLKKKPR